MDISSLMWFIKNNSSIRVDIARLQDINGDILKEEKFRDGLDGRISDLSMNKVDYEIIVSGLLKDISNIDKKLSFLRVLRSNLEDKIEIVFLCDMFCVKNRGILSFDYGRNMYLRVYDYTVSEYSKDLYVHYRDVIYVLGKSMQFGLNNSALHYYIGMCYKFLGDKISAVNSFGKSVILDGRNKDSLMEKIEIQQNLISEGQGWREPLLKVDITLLEMLEW